MSINLGDPYDFHKRMVHLTDSGLDSRLCYLLGTEGTGTDLSEKKMHE